MWSCIHKPRHAYAKTHTRRNIHSIVCIHTDTCMLYMNPLTLLIGFHSPHQTKHCNLSPSLSRFDLRPLKVSRSVCGGKKCQSCGFQRRAERLLCGGWLLYMLCFCPWGAVFLGSTCVFWSEGCLGLIIWAELSWAEGFWQEEEEEEKLFHLWGLLWGRMTDWCQTDRWRSSWICVVVYLGVIIINQNWS